ncbi:stage III sporulation protein AC [Clostridium sartagoforme]|uniref:Stage III sporulation protein AC n=1 Tax=Clostridium sartagoforme TaxID=84031 RepID=A0A4S2DPK5_9CLOT|nr:MULTISPECIES: stage III sporulation protein AC [Clostridium]MBS5938948.1 stage III sporulation protein AC [Clostridium sp.]MDU5111864.1 stage III sporulation protein AC [Clostridium sp.]TGY44346.1 stage III sporulation protein AC [Clostridium sartagoforme]
MLDISILFKIGAMGVLLIVIDKVLKASGKDDVAVITNIAGIVIILITVIGLITDLFNSVRTMFMF